jgi:LysM repeat protein
MQNFEAALQSMMEVIQVKSGAPSYSKSTDSDNPHIYKVQPGDSLERIARAKKVSVQSLRDANQLNNDRIIVGQKLKIP